MKLVKESLYFERPTSEKEYRNKLLGFREGQLIKRMEEVGSKNEKIFMIVKKHKNYELKGEELLMVQNIGNLIRKKFKSPLINFIHDKELKDYLYYFQENKLALTDLVIKLIKDDLSTKEGKEFLDKLKLKIGLVPFEIIN